MNKSKKSIIIFVFILFPVFMWGETYFFWDLGSGSIDARINQNRFESNLSLAIGDLYLKEEKTNLVFDYVKNEISFDQKKICDDEIPMIPFVQDSLYYINFKVGEKYERGLIDTGNSVLVTRKNFLQNDEYLTDDSQPPKLDQI